MPMAMPSTITFRFRHQLRVLSILLCLGFSGCSLFAFEKEWSSPQPTFVHEVRYPGETLGLISEWYAGSPRHWRAILQSNAGLDVRRIAIGTKLNIPRELVRQQRPLTKAAIERWHQHNGPARSQLIVARHEKSERPDIHYAYPVQKISGCENLPNSFDGLSACAERVESGLAGALAAP